MEENLNEQKTVEFQEWLEKNNWKFNEESNLYINKEKKELKTNDELVEIFEHEKELAEIEAQKKKEVQLKFELFLNKNNWRPTHNPDEYINRKTGDKKKVTDLVEDFKAEIAKEKEIKEEKVEVKKEEKTEVKKETKIESKLKPIVSKTIEEKEVKEISEEEGIKLLSSHKHQGRVKRYYTKEGVFMKRVKLFDANGKDIINEFCFKAKDTKRI